jgi:hypothetical protein
MSCKRSALTIARMRCWGSPQPVPIKIRLPLTIFDIASDASTILDAY